MVYFDFHNIIVDTLLLCTAQFRHKRTSPATIISAGRRRYFLPLSRGGPSLFSETERKHSRRRRRLATDQLDRQIEYVRADGGREDGVRAWSCSVNPVYRRA